MLFTREHNMDDMLQPISVTMEYIEQMKAFEFTARINREVVAKLCVLQPTMTPDQESKHRNRVVEMAGA